MRILKTKTFNKWAKKNYVLDELLVKAAKEISDGVFEANLGGNILKKRIATKGRGKSGSVRTIVAFKVKGHCFFMFGFEKGERSSISENEERALKLVAKGLLTKVDCQLDELVSKGVLFEVNYE